ncbi:LysM peptidoglycan-binding domain-containing protein [Candidatus Puniceispirillum sp.]|nr:LysM peptidoglycan-binding domain-containing protein [Candidatus Puniceispirillum sp.]
MEPVRAILYILFAVGGILVVLALSMVFSDNELAQIKPQSETIELETSEIVSGRTQTNDQLMASAKTVTKQQSLSTQSDADASSMLKIDIARVKPDGAAVFAGTAAPNAEIRIFEGKILLGKTVANSAGEWVIILEKSLAVGQHLISIAMERDDGSTAFADVRLVVEIYGDAATKPLVALLPETSTEVPVLIQSPDDGKSATTNIAGTDRSNSNEPQQEKVGAVPTVNGSPNAGVDLTVTATEVRSKSVSATIVPTAIVWRDATRILISGTSRGGVRVIANDTKAPFGEALVLADGAWQIAGSLNMEKTNHHLKFELMNDRDKIIANYTLPLTSRDLAKGQNGTPLVVVNKGDALWRIAYRRFGDGIRYVDIVRRNQSDIVDPDLIYPKQIFALPRSAKDTTNLN